MRIDVQNESAVQLPYPNPTKLIPTYADNKYIALMLVNVKLVNCNTLL